MFSATVSRRSAAVPRTDVPHRRGIDAPRHARTTPSLFEKVHETRCFSRSPRWQARTVRNATAHAAHIVGMSAKVYGDCRSASGEPRISGTAQAGLRKTAQARRPSEHPAANSPDRPRPSRWSVMHRSGGVENACTRMRGIVAACTARRASAAMQTRAEARRSDSGAGMHCHAFIRAGLFGQDPVRQRSGHQCSPVRKGRPMAPRYPTQATTGGGNECGAEHSLRAAWCCAPRRAHRGGRSQWSSSSSSSA